MKVVILRGVSGSGKTTYIKKNHPEALVCSADSFFYNEDDEYHFDARMLSEAHRACFSKFLLLLKANHDCDITVVVDNTNSTAAEISPYYMAAEVYGVPTEIVRLDCRTEVAAKRNKHGTPFHTIRNMRNRFDRLPPYWPRERVIRTDEGENI